MQILNLHCLSAVNLLGARHSAAELHRFCRMRIFWRRAPAEATTDPIMGRLAGRLTQSVLQKSSLQSAAAVAFVGTFDAPIVRAVWLLAPPVRINYVRFPGGACDLT